MSLLKDLLLGFAQIKIVEAKAKEVFDKEVDKRKKEAKDPVAEVRKKYGK